MESFVLRVEFYCSFSPFTVKWYINEVGQDARNANVRRRTEQRSYVGHLRLLPSVLAADQQETRLSQDNVSAYCKVKKLTAILIDASGEKTTLLYPYLLLIYTK